MAGFSSLGLSMGSGFDILINDNYMEFNEMTEPAAPALNKARLYVKDVGGKTALYVRFNTGAVQQIAIEP